MSWYPKLKFGVYFSIILCIGIFLFIGKIALNEDVSMISREDALTDYDYMWDLLENNYPFLNMAERKYGLSMEALKAKYRSRIEALGANQMDFSEYYELMQECIGKFKGLAHLAILSPYSYQSAFTDLESTKQDDLLDDMGRWMLALYSDPDVKKRYEYLIEKYKADAGGQRADIQNLTFKVINEDTAYVKIDSFAASYIQADQSK